MKTLKLFISFVSIRGKNKYDSIFDMKILVIQQKMIGDVLVSSILCNNLRKIYSKAQIDYLIYPHTQAVVENNPNIDKIILFDDSFRKSKLSFFKFLIKIKKEQYDLVIDAYGKLESNLISLFSGAKKRIAHYKKYNHFIYTNTVTSLKIPVTNAGLAIENRLLLLASLQNGIVFDNKPKIHLTADEIKNGKQVLESHNIDFSKKIYMISVLGSARNKTYTLEYMAKILDEIVLKTNATLLFNYMPSQKNEAQLIFDLCQTKTQKNIKIEVSPKGIRAFLSITHHCNALIGNEGGAVNMAKALNIPTFTLFSTWIIKEAWNSFEDGTQNVSVHLKDFKPELYGTKTAKDMKNKAMELYQEFTPDLVLPSLQNYLAIN